MARAVLDAGLVATLCAGKLAMTCSGRADADVPAVRLLPQQGVPDAAAHHVGFVGRFGSNCRKNLPPLGRRTADRSVVVGVMAASLGRMSCHHSPPLVPRLFLGAGDGADRLHVPGQPAR